MSTTTALDPMYRYVEDPVSRLRLYELSHPWGSGAPTLPGFEDPVIKRQVNHSEHGVLSHRIRTIMHTGTHVNAPHHLVQRAAGVGELPLGTFFGTGVVIGCEKEEWDLVRPEDLAGASIRPGDIVLVVTGWHRHYSDSQRYFAHAPGLSKEAAQLLVDRGAKLVGIDTASVDHPLATSLGAHRNGPTARYLPQRYRERTGVDPARAFPEWNPAHRLLLEAGIPTIENVGGDVAALLGHRVTLQAMPWRWPGGDACQIRLVALADPGGEYRIERGDGPGLPAPAAAGPDAAGHSAAGGLELVDLTHVWGHGMPEWPSAPGIQVHPRLLHSMHGVSMFELDGIMHRGTHMDAPIHVTEDWPSISDYELWRFFGTGVAVSIPKGKWGVITPEDLEAARPAIQPNDIVMINTGSHHLWGDNDDYFAYSPGLYEPAARWLVERGVKLVGVGVQALDHPLGTKLVNHGPGPSHPHLIEEYRSLTGREVSEDFPKWEPSHKTLMGNGIPGIENIGGDLDAVTGRRCTFMAFPWRWIGGDGSGVRVVAAIDPSGEYRIEPGEPY